MPSAKTMKVVVTGGSGLFGRYVTSELSQAGYEVLNLDRVAHPRLHRPSWLVDLLKPGDIYQACSGAEAVVHLAGRNAPGLASDTTTFNENIQMTYNVLKAASDSGVARVVVASSLAAYGFLYEQDETVPDYLPIDEMHPCRPTDPYGLSKLLSEQLCDAFVRSGLSIVSLRLPGINYDPAYKRVLNLMATPDVRKRGFWTYIDARDAAVAVRLCIEKSKRGHRVFNIAAPRSNMREDTRDLIERFYPGLSDIRNLAKGNWSGMTSQLAQDELGFTAAFSWEHYLASAKAGGQSGAGDG